MTSKEMRDNAAALARDIRNMELEGSWTRREWNNQVRIAIRNYIENMKYFQKANPS